MTGSTKRSISPRTVSEGDENEPKRSKITKFFSYWFSKLSSDKDDGAQRKVAHPQYEFKTFQNEPLMNDFTSEKKKRLSLQSQSRYGFTPRSSTLNNSAGIYRTYYDNLQTEKEGSNNDLERRVDNSYGSLVKDGANLVRPMDNLRDNSPIGFLERNETSTPESIIEYRDETPFQGEGDVFPLYTDNDGNLVRPPFINLDPRERYHLLQLKKSLEIAETMRKRMKFMVDPLETNSQKVGNTGKVEVATQTNNFDSLESSLDHTSFKRKLKFNQLKKSKRGKNSGGFFVGEFFYDGVKSSDDAKQNQNRKSTIDKPILFGKSESKNEQTAVNENEDSYSFRQHTKPSLFKSTKDRHGLDDCLSSNKKMEVNIDSNFKHKPASIANVIKLKDSATYSNGSQSQPNTGFQFSINKTDVDRVIKKRTERDNDIIKETGNTNSNKDTNSGGFFGFKGSSMENEKAKSSMTSQPIKSNDKSFDLFKSSSTSKGEQANPFSFDSGGSKENKLSSFSVGGTNNSLSLDSNAPLSQHSNTESETNNKRSFNGSIGVDFSRPMDNSERTKENSINFDQKRDVSFEHPNINPDSSSKNTTISANAGISNKPLFSFESNAKSTSNTVADKSYENTQKPAFSLDASQKSDMPTSSNTFTFGTNKSAIIPDSSDIGGKSLPSSKEKESSINQQVNTDSGTKSFEFSSTKDSLPKKSLFNNTGGNNETFSFGGASDGPFKKRNLVENPTDKKAPFTFNGSKDEPSSKKSLFDGQTEKPSTFSFGGHNPNNSKSSIDGKSTNSQAFSFGNSQGLSSSGPAFNFSGSTKTQDSSETSANQTRLASLQTSAPSSSSATPAKPMFSFSQPSGGFNPNGSATFGANTFSKENTPNQFGFSASTPPFQQPQQQQTQIKPSFNFTGTPSKEPTPDPAAIFGGINQSVPNSREGTPFNFGGNNNSMNGLNKFGAQNPGVQSFSPPFGSNPPVQNIPSQPIISNRKIAQMRQRRR